MPDNLKKLKDILNIIKIPKEDFAKYFNVVMKIIQQKEKKLDNSIVAFETLYKKLEQKLKTDSTLTSAEVKRLTTAELDSLLRRFSSKSTELDIKMSSVQKERELDETKIIDSVLAQVKLPEYKEVILDDAVGLRNKLETLEGKEELKLTVIDELKKELEEKINAIPKGMVGGIGDANIKFAMSRLVHTETPSGLINGSNKTYTVLNTINTVLSFGINGMIIHSDEYSTSKGTITFVVALPASLSGKSFEMKYV